MKKPALILFLRVTGTVAGSAALCALMPMTAMDTIHRMLGMGPLPMSPILEYLARSTSFAYALLGTLLWTVSFDIARYFALIRGIGYTFLILSIFLLATDIQAQLPLFWQVMEGPSNALLGSVLLLLCRKNSLQTATPVAG